MARHLPRHGPPPVDGQRRGTDARVLAPLAAPDGHRRGSGGCAMTAARVAVSRQHVADFHSNEAALLDEWQLDDWLLLFDEDGKYEVPCNDAVDGDPAQDLMLIDDNYARLSARVARLNSRRAHREYPHSRTNHQIFNCLVADPDEHDEIGVTASFTVWRLRRGRAGRHLGPQPYPLRPPGNRVPSAIKRRGPRQTE